MRNHLKTTSILLFLLIIFLGSCQNQTNEKDEVQQASTIPNDIAEINTNGPLLTGSIIIDDDSRFQSIYSGQNYGTFYEIYARFNFDTQNHLETIDLILQNYNGPIDIGFSELFEPNSNDLFIFEDSSLIIFPVVQGLANPKNATLNINSDSIRPDDIKEFDVYRILTPLSDERETYMVNNVFDSEFHYRSGKEVHDYEENRNQRFWLFDIREKALNPKARIKEFKTMITTAKGGNCYSSKNNVGMKN